MNQFTVRNQLFTGIIVVTRVNIIIVDLHHICMCHLLVNLCPYGLVDLLFPVCCAD